MTTKTASKKPSREKIIIRVATLEDIPGIIEVAKRAYAAWPSSHLANERNYTMQIRAFPTGQFVAVAGDRIVGYANSLIVQLDAESPWYNYAEVTGYSSFSTHTPSGDTLYGADIAVDPEWQGKGISSKLYKARKTLLKRHNLKQMVAGGRIPGYAEYKGLMSADEYVQKVIAGELKDQALKAHLKAGYRVEGVHYGYLNDQESMGYATHLVMDNPDFQATKRMIAGAPVRRTARHVRVCATQYDQRKITSLKDFEDQIEYYVDTAACYDSHLLVFPEFVTVQMFSTFVRDIPLADAINYLVEMADDLIEIFRSAAIRHKLFIVGGSTVLRRENGLFNVAHFFTPAGNVYTQDKMHITPAEKEGWNIRPGEKINIFETPIGRLAICVCYDIEFPEYIRLLVEHGVDIILNPFATDEKKSYLRVRYCAQARAVENMVYVVLSGNVGGLSNSPSMFLNYGQAAICTPSDFAFPMDGVAAEGVVNTSTVVIADLDLGTLDIQRQTASVRPPLDRRHDVYELKARIPIERVIVV
jgi:predicted amidohydrolase/GNAT superfamily N-acetyltransferase